MLETDESYAIDVKDLTFSYPDAPPTLRNVDWCVPQGELVLLTGDTGCGKTTLLRCLKPEMAPTGSVTGTVQLFGCDVAAMSVKASATTVGYVAQNPATQMVCDRVWHEMAFGLENIGMEPDAMRRRVAEVSAFFGLDRWMQLAVTDLSGGQQQKLTLAAAMAMQPRVLLLDEPTAQLDPVSEKNFLHALFRINRELGVTVVVATHAPEAMANYATRCVELRDGGIVERRPEDFSASTAAIPPPHVWGRVVSHADDPVVLADVFQKYRRESPWVLRGCDVSVASGSVHALVGGNGCGKSTVLRVMARVAKTQRGNVRNALGGRQALVPQDPRTLFVCDSVAEEVREWQARCGYDEAAIAEMMKRLGLQGLDGRHPYDLSGGQQQKLALAKVLLCAPELLLLDEPTKGLDARSKLQVADVLRRLRADGCTLILATHDLPFVLRVADEATMLFDGQAACTQRAEDFFTGNLFYRPLQDGFAAAFDEREGALQ